MYKSRVMRPCATRARRAERFLADSQNPQVLADVRKLLTEEKEALKFETELCRLQRQYDEAVRWEEKRQADIDKAALRQAEVERGMAHKSVVYWEKLIKSVNAATDAIAILFKEHDNMPPLTQAHVQLLDRALDRLKGQVHRMEVKLHPNGGRYSLSKDVIDV